MSSQITRKLFNIDDCYKMAITSVPEYWIADLRNNRLLVYSNPAGDAYQSIRELRRGDTLEPTLLP